MKIALLGKGKTGGKVIELMQLSNIFHTIFDSKNTPTIEKLIGHDVIISFLPGEAFTSYIPLLIETKIPVICGSTGMSFEKDFDLKLKNKNITWIYATNFSLGMNLVQQMILIMGQANKLFNDYKFSLNETHHTQKLDSPSGTALSWKSWTNHDMTINSFRNGDAIGIHELILSTPFEEISLKHNALDRKIFAEGALYAAKKISEQLAGLHLFQNIVQQELTRTNLGVL